jgi:hypothetical protein
MSSNWVDDIEYMHDKYGVWEVVNKMDQETLRALLDFRIKFLQEELDELRGANNPDDVIDALIDLCVVAIGTLDMLDAPTRSSWDRVLEANMAKEVGVKESRPNPLGLPDLIKPVGWKAPYHGPLYGPILDKLFPQS